MFTGLIEKMGTLRRVSRGRGLVLEIGFEPWPEPLAKGESVAVNGVCLTVADCDRTRFTAHVLAETESRSTLAGLLPGAKVNLERALRAGSRLGGHIVQGHVDARGKLLARTPKGRDFALKFSCGHVVAAATVLKGSIAVNGVSLTVSGLGDESSRRIAERHGVFKCRSRMVSKRHRIRPKHTGSHSTTQGSYVPDVHIHWTSLAVRIKELQPATETGVVSFQIIGSNLVTFISIQFQVASPTNRAVDMNFLVFACLELHR